MARRRRRARVRRGGIHGRCVFKSARRVEHMWSRLVCSTAKRLPFEAPRFLDLHRRGIKASRMAQIHACLHAQAAGLAGSPAHAGRVRHSRPPPGVLQALNARSPPIHKLRPAPAAGAPHALTSQPFDREAVLRPVRGLARSTAWQRNPHRVALAAAPARPSTSQMNQQEQEHLRELEARAKAHVKVVGGPRLRPGLACQVFQPGCGRRASHNGAGRRSSRTPRCLPRSCGTRQSARCSSASTGWPRRCWTRRLSCSPTRTRQGLLALPTLSALPDRAARAARCCGLARRGWLMRAVLLRSCTT
jgi:hypothetical protein